MDSNFDFNYEEIDDYSYDNNSINNNSLTEEISFKVHTTCFTEVMCLLLLVVNVIIFLLGIGGNGVVIWIAGFRMKKSVNTTWYLSLAVSDFIFCSFLPFNIAYSVTSDWIFGLFMCKFTSFVMFLNMFSSIFLLVIISVDRCVAVIFPVWAQNHRSVGKASFIIVLAWFVSAALSVPSIVYRDVQHHLGIGRCMNNYTSSPYTHEIIAMSRFVFGFVIPFLLIIVCYTVIILRLKASQIAKSSKPFKIMTSLIVTFFLCWAPYHAFVLIELYKSFLSNDIKTNGLRIGTTVAAANSFLNPVLYVFMGSDFRKKFKSSVFSKIENAIGEEGRTMSRYLSRSSSVDAKASTHI
nr:chemokine-like receptor 1 [Misgurnus anguillicaudatus]